MAVHLLFAKSTTRHSTAPALVRSEGAGSLQSAQGREAGVTPELLVAPAEQVRRDPSLASQSD
jgi:hypothetical protein